MDVEEIKRKLKTYTEEQIMLKEHALIKCFQRGITREMVVDHLTNPEKLIDAIEEESKYLGERKFKLIFELSRNKNFIVIVVMNRKLNIVTVVIRYRKWMRQVML
jgi:hypothetical protein